MNLQKIRIKRLKRQLSYRGNVDDDVKEKIELSYRRIYEIESRRYLILLK